MLRNVISVIDGAAGSCGKGKVIGEIATDERVNLGAAITNCMPNAGHTFVDKQGHKTVFQNIPVSTVNPKTELFIGPGSAIDMISFKEEYERVKELLGDRKIYVHELVPLIDERHKEYERLNIKTGSTFKGCGAVIQEKIIRYPFLGFFETYENAVKVPYDEWLDRLYTHIDNEEEYTLLEGAQGCDLCLNHSGNYPYVTSRNVSTTQCLADSGISAERLLQTLMVIRPFPIRISNITKDGDFIYTGDYGTGAELSWSQINIASMSDTYPFKGDLDLLYSYNPNVKYIRKLLSHLPVIYLKQLFGDNFKNINIDNLSLVEMMEIERLYYKSKGINCYQTKLMDLSMWYSDKELLPNTIFDQSEQTTVTKMERRVFDLDINKLKNNCRINTPSAVYLNFFQHLDYDFSRRTGNYNDIYFNRYIREYLDWLESSIQEVTRKQSEIVALGTGPRNGERILKKELVKSIIR